MGETIKTFPTISINVFCSDLDRLKRKSKIVLTKVNRIYTLFLTMKQLETQFTLDNNNFTQVKRSAKAALYKRETLEGAFISFEVFSIKSKDGVEVYPNQTAAGKWCWCPIKAERAEKYFNNIDSGDIVVPDVDPITGEYVRSEEDNKSLEQVLAEADPAPLIVTNIDPTAPAEIPTPEVVMTDSPTPEVTATADGGAVVEVAKVKKNRNTTNVQMVIPSGEFTQAEFAKANGLPERGVVWGKLDALVQAGKLKKDFKQVGKGRPAAVYVGV